MPEKSKTPKKSSKTTKGVKKTTKEKPTKTAADKKYYEAVGRRKQAIARVRLYTAGPSESVEEGNLVINNKPYKEYFPTLALQKIIETPFIRLKSISRFKATIKVKGGGPAGQAEAIRHGLSRTLVIFDENFRKKLKKSGYLKRDPRKKERKKFGLKKARRAPQWRKR